MRMDGLENNHCSVSPPKSLCSFITLHSRINSFTPFCFESQHHFCRLLLSVTAPSSEEKFLTKYFRFLHRFLFPPEALPVHLTCSFCALGPTLVPLCTWKQTFKRSYSTRIALVYHTNLQGTPQNASIYRKTNTRRKNYQGERWEVSTTPFLLQRVYTTKTPWFITVERRVCR